MGDITIATSASASAVDQWLNREMSIMSHEGLQVTLTQVENGDQTFFTCQCDATDKSAEEVFVYYVASALAGTILSAVETNWVKQRLRRLYKTLPVPDREIITGRILEILNQAYEDGEGVPRARVLLDIMDYLDLYHSVHLEGFVRFRLKDYLRQIESAVDNAIAEYDAHQEQQEFIELLRYFMASQESRLDFIEVILQRNGLFRLLDEGHNTIDNHFLEGFVADLVQGTVDYGDLLISALITLAPKQLRCHCEEDSPVVDTLRAVFAERLSICRGCEICGRQKSPMKGSLPARPKGC